MNERKKPGRTFLILILGSLMTVSPFAIDLYLPAFGEIARGLGTTTAKMSLSIASYFAGVAIGQLIYGPLLDRYGRKPPLYFGMTLFIIASIGCALAQSIEVLVAIRFVQALGGCVTIVAALAMVRDFFPPEQNAQILSLLMLVLGTSPLLAPTVGGFISVYFGWQWIFISLAGIVLLILLLIVIYLPNARPPDKTVSLKAGPMISTFLGILKTPAFHTYALSGAFSFATLFIYVASSPLIFMDIFHVSPTTYGIIFAVLSVGFISSNQVNILLLRKFSSDQVMRVALVCQFIFGVIFFIGVYYHWYDLVGTTVMFFLCLACIGFIYPNASALALAPFTRNVGSASALIGFLQIGIAGLSSSIVGFFDTGDSVPAMALLAATSGVALAIVMFMGKRSLAKVSS